MGFALAGTLGLVVVLVGVLAMFRMIIVLITMTRAKTMDIVMLPTLEDVARDAAALSLLV